MSFNTQHCLNYREKKIDFDVMARAITTCGADVVGLNEMRGCGPREDYEDQVRILSEKTGLKHFYFAQAIRVNGENPYGNGILSRYPIKTVGTVHIPDPDPKKDGRHYEHRCILRAVLENGVTVLVTHFGLNPDEQKNAVATVLEQIPERACVLMGDFNVTPEDPVLAPIRARLNDTADLFSEPLLSFPSDNPTKKIDYIFTSTDVAVTDADIPPVVASDHRPHLATLRFDGE